MKLIEILLPVYDNEGTPLGNGLFEEVRRELAAQFGGVTAFARAPAEGFWKEHDGKVIRDDIVIFEVMAEELDREWWRGYGERLRQRFRQEELVVRAAEVERL